MELARRSLSWVLVAAITACLSWWILSHAHHSAAMANLSQGVPYQVLNDDMGGVISIGVEPDINEQQLRETLAKVANDHQDDRARDYIGLYLWIEAYLVEGGHQSSVRAGRLRRFVPFANPEERKAMKLDRTRFDAYEITLEPARKTLTGVGASVPAHLQYDILEEDSAVFINIAVDSKVDEQQLRALLLKAANEHSAETKRSCGPSLNLWIQAYLRDDGRRSKVPAGGLRRIIPIEKQEARNPTISDWAKFDKFEITLEEAKRSLQ